MRRTITFFGYWMDELVGYLTVYKSHHGDLLTVLRIAVKKKFRRNYIATHMFESLRLMVLYDDRFSDVTHIVTHVRDTNRVALSLFSSLGFLFDKLINGSVENIVRMTYCVHKTDTRRFVHYQHIPIQGGFEFGVDYDD